tara:strand:+ start:4431 stop:4583 length:153 start_codon:yes stop_codon:yes gene_type:complete
MLAEVKICNISFLREQSLLNYKKMVIKAIKTCRFGQLLFSSLFFERLFYN